MHPIAEAEVRGQRDCMRLDAFVMALETGSVAEQQHYDHEGDKEMQKAWVAAAEHDFQIPSQKCWRLGLDCWLRRFAMQRWMRSQCVARMQYLS